MCDFVGGKLLRDRKAEALGAEGDPGRVVGSSALLHSTPWAPEKVAMLANETTLFSGSHETSILRLSYSHMISFMSG